MMSSSDDDVPGDDTGVLLETRTKTKRPPLYKVMILNDDYTPMEFVVYLLEVAETKVGQVMDIARRHQHPLQCTMEKE